MADRIPLIVNTAASQIQELASTDNLALSSKLLVTNSTDSTSKDTGSAIIDGGVGIEKNLHVGGTGTFIGNVTAPVFMGSANAVSLTNDTGSTFRQLIFTSATGAGLNAPLLIDNTASGAGIQFRPSDNTLRVDGDIIAYHTSDKRVKENLKKIENPIEKIMGLNGYTFTWKETAVPEIGYEGVTPKHEDTGVVAQEVEGIDLPDIINVRSSGIKAVRYSKLIPLLIEAVKELSTELDALKKDYQKHNH